MIEHILAHMFTVNKDGDVQAQAILIIEDIAAQHWITAKDMTQGFGYVMSINNYRSIRCDGFQVSREEDVGHA